MKISQAIALLELSENFSLLELKSAYRKSALRYHPDCGGKQEDFIKIDQAYDFLKSYATDAKTFNQSIYWESRISDLREKFRTEWKKYVKKAKDERTGLWFSTCIERFSRSYTYPRKEWFYGLILGVNASEKKKREFQELLKEIAPNQKMREQWALKYYRLELGEETPYVFYLMPCKLPMPA